MVSLTLQVTDKILASLVTIVESLSEESQKQYGREINYLQLFIANANNAFLGNTVEIVDFDYWELTQKPTNTIRLSKPFGENPLDYPNESKIMKNEHKCKDCGSKAEHSQTDKYNCFNCGVRDEVTGEH